MWPVNPGPGHLHVCLRARRPSTFDGGGDGMPNWCWTMLFFIVGVREVGPD